MKQIKWETNFNNKLNSNNVFMHLDLAPSSCVPESKMPQQVIILTKDESAAPKKCYLLYFIRLKMQNIVDSFTLLSHGKLSVEFIREKMDADKRINWQTEMALYFYSTDENIKDFFVPILDNTIEN